MTQQLFVGEAQTLHTSDGRIFDPWNWSWERSGDPGDDLRPIEPLSALLLVGRSGNCRKVPIGVIGPRDASPQQAEIAESLGRELAGLGLAVVCGGKGGVMEAVARGVHEAKGLCIGLLPEADWRAANPYVSLPIATGIGKARNVLIAQSAAALIAVGGQYGTLSEIAFGLHFDKPVFGLGDVPDVPGIRRAASVHEVCTGLAVHLLRVPGLS